MATPSPDPSSRPAFLSRQVQEYRYFFVKPSSLSRPDLAVVCGGWEKCAPNYEVNRSKFAYYGIEYVMGGRGLLTLHGVKSPLSPGAVFAYGPASAHTIRSSENAPLIKYFVDFHGKAAQRLISQKVLGPQGIAYTQDAHPIHDLFEQLLETGSKGNALTPRLCQALLELLSLRIEENAGQDPTLAHNRARQTFDRCRQELQKHFTSLMSVTDLADRTHLDRAYLARLFQRFSEESPYEMLIRLKMNHASAQLFSGRYTVKEVATEVGFTDPYHFSRVFKKHYGISPGRFQEARARIR